MNNMSWEEFKANNPMLTSDSLLKQGLAIMGRYLLSLVTIYLGIFAVMVVIVGIVSLFE